MNNNHAKFVYLLLAIIGILSLFLASWYVKPKITPACKIVNTSEKDYVLVKGTIIKERNLTENFKLLTLKNTCEVEVTCNCLTSMLKKNVSVIGKIQFYQNKTQIQAEKILED